jgi:hypothetical protein
MFERGRKRGESSASALARSHPARPPGRWRRRVGHDHAVHRFPAARRQPEARRFHDAAAPGSGTGAAGAVAA